MSVAYSESASGLRVPQQYDLDFGSMVSLDIWSRLREPHITNTCATKHAFHSAPLLLFSSRVRKVHLEWFIVGTTSSVLYVVPVRICRASERLVTRLCAWPKKDLKGVLGDASVLELTSTKNMQKVRSSTRCADWFLLETARPENRVNGTATRHRPALHTAITLNRGVHAFSQARLPTPVEDHVFPGRPPNLSDRVRLSSNCFDSATFSN
ncbi:hypothetical protein CC78DRAFT_576328 [Lojkania enalia]|uniref:Uncharacterized protein n=1 Tax=Lojkania enalia TaxID=147567 RepID=A0A9P4N871_9PLEO|nr:hypothetical protein CC78DRAFT_576328 [Didymosphaeria enalia]